VFDDILATVAPWLTAGLAERPVPLLRQVLRRSAVTLHEHAPVLRAAHENAHVSAELGAAWFATMDRCRTALRGEIEAERARRRVPADDAALLASTLIWASERLFYLSTRGVDPSVAGPEDAVEALLTIWVPAIYGTPYSPP
jgi:hypothetical protein